MSLRTIVHIPDPVLKEVSEEVGQIDNTVRKLVNDMFETMYEAPGIGLAAIQIAEPVRVLTMDVTRTKDDEAADPNPIAMINPKIVWSSDETSVYEEGCLSIPDYYADVERPAEVRVDYLDIDGQEQHMHADGLLATCVQHEIDHLDGKLFIDYLSRMKRQMVIRKFTKIARQKSAVL